MSFLLGFINRQFISHPPIPTVSFKGRTVILTGSNVGLGLEASRRMVRLGAAQVVLACRNIEKGNAAAKDIQESTSCPPGTLLVWKLDMSSYASVQAFAEKARAELPRLDALVLNAGLGTRRFRMTEDNEETITTNVVSLSLLALLLHPKLRETAAAFNTQTHLTVTASELYEVAKLKEREAPEVKLFAALNDPNKANMADRYNVSKLLEVFFIKQLATLSPLSTSNVIINCVAPGQLHREHDNVAVRVLTRIFARPTEVGSRTLVYGASAGSETHGQYVPDCKVTVTKGLTHGDEGAELQGRIWAELSQKLEAIQQGVTVLS
ncbi:NAD(P)-binding protein [Dactylonectria estremocensis]|uniref:NAD(P)-binding protein n=1 Tax=Dactylonectria estremocensis TaxID=1079267 RepID=A0A9P9IXM9_9HYPO|nr:NAD(P)-binding protein [Dactylonectria estremocensis]